MSKDLNSSYNITLRSKSSQKKKQEVTNNKLADDDDDNNNGDGDDGKVFDISERASMSAISDRPNWKTYLERSSMISTTTSSATAVMMHGQDDMMIKTTSKKATTPATSSRLSRNLRSLITSATSTVATAGFSLTQKDGSSCSNDSTTTKRTTNTTTATTSSSSPSDKRTSRSMTEAIISAYKSVSPKVFSNLGAKEDGDDDGRERVDPSLQAAHHHSIDISTSDRDGQVSVSACEKQHHDDFKVDAAFAAVNDEDIKSSSSSGEGNSYIRPSILFNYQSSTTTTTIGDNGSRVCINSNHAYDRKESESKAVASDAYRGYSNSHSLLDRGSKASRVNYDDKYDDDDDDDDDRKAASKEDDHSDDKHEWTKSDYGHAQNKNDNDDGKDTTGDKDSSSKMINELKEISLEHDDDDNDDYRHDNNDDDCGLVVAEVTSCTYFNGVNDDNDHYDNDEGTVMVRTSENLSFTNTIINPTIAVPINAEVDAKPLALIRFLHLLITYSPSKSLKELLQQIEPIVTKWASAIHFILLSLYITFEILLELSFELYSILKPFRLDLLLPAFMGLIICFFGGSFVTTIAAVEAFRIVGYDSTLQCIRDLSDEFNAILEASKKDLDGDFFEQVDKLTAQVATVDAVTDHRHDDDDDSNNIVHARHVTTSPRRSSTATSPSSSYLRRRASSSSSSSSTTSPTPSQHSHYRRRGSSHHQPLSPGSPPLSLEEYQREQEMEVPDTVASKALYFLHHVDPHKFTNAVIGINAGFVAVIATLKLQFAKTITLGSSISKGLETHLQPLLLPTMKSLLPRRHRKWAQLALSLSFKSIAISIAWSIRRVISCYHSAIRGGLLCSKNILLYLRCMGYLSDNNNKSSNSSDDDASSGGGDSKHDDDGSKKAVGLDALLQFEFVLGYLLALCGIIFQLSFGFSLPFPLNVILFPITIIEYILVWIISNSSNLL